MLKRLEREPTPDVVLESLEHDTAGRNDEIIRFVEILEAAEGPYAILLDAPWGDGKTFFIKSVIQAIRAFNPRLAADEPEMGPRVRGALSNLTDGEVSLLPFYFNAWENDYSDDPVSALLACMAAEFDSSDATKELRARKVVASAIDTALATVHLDLRVSEISEALKGEDLIEAYRKRASLRTNIDELAAKSNIEIANKLVIFIDELDRCRPDFSVKLLEQVKSLFQSENIVVVLVCDSLQLAHAVGGMYGNEFDTQHFLERFYDRRILLSHADGFKVINGEGYQRTSSSYDTLVTELLERNPLTIRDCMRVNEKIAAGRKYCEMSDAGDGGSYVAKCAVVPLLIFLQREDINAYRRITHGLDYDALYEYGKNYNACIDILNRRLDPDCMANPNVSSSITEERRREFMHNLCIALYATNRNSKEVRAAQSAIGNLFWCNGYDQNAFELLQFPNECYEK